MYKCRANIQMKLSLCCSSKPSSHPILSILLSIDLVFQIDKLSSVINNKIGEIEIARGWSGDTGTFY